LEELGYVPIRADAEIGTVIVKDMLERLALAELVLADITLPNGNVYYEVGLRHVAKRTHCVLIAADWSKQLFDTDQIRTGRYPLKDGSVPEEEAVAIRELLIKLIPRKRDSLTPFYELVKDKESSTVFREQVNQISAFQAEVRAARQLGDSEARQAKVRKIRDRFEVHRLDLPEVALELMTLIRDSLGWEELVQFVDSLPPALKEHAFIKEQVLLAKSELGDPELAIEELKELIRLQGPTPERHGLIGGRYKRLWRAARKKRPPDAKGPGLKELAHLDAAIEAYRSGMEQDYNEYYCASNLPSLLRDRGNKGDEEEAQFLDKLIVRACERMIARGEDDGWAKPTLLGAAFRAGDVDRIEKLVVDVARQGAAAWKLKSTLDDINDTVAATADDATREALGRVRDQLAALAADV